MTPSAMQMTITALAIACFVLAVLLWQLRAVAVRRRTLHRLLSRPEAIAGEVRPSEEDGASADFASAYGRLPCVAYRIRLLAPEVDEDVVWTHSRSIADEVFTNGFTIATREGPVVVDSSTELLVLSATGRSAEHVDDTGELASLLSVPEPLPQDLLVREEVIEMGAQVRAWGALRNPAAGGVRVFDSVVVVSGSVDDVASGPLAGVDRVWKDLAKGAIRQS